MEIKEVVNGKVNSNQILSSANINDLRLACPECDLIPALFFDIKSRNIYQVSAGCENKHLISSMPIKTYYEKCMKLKNPSKNTLGDFICLKHNSNYNSFCKTCKKNICKECSDTEHNNHFISQFYELLPSNEEIIQLKNSIDNEINDVNVFLVETFHKWINELQEKFHELIENIKCKNKLYNFIINFYETKEFNYQNIYNIKTVAENQMKRNPLTQEIQTLKNIMTRNEHLLKSKSKEENIEEKEKFLKLKTAQFLKILNILNSDVNSNYQFVPFSSTEKSLQTLRFLLLLGILHNGSDDEVVRYGTDGSHRDVGNGVLQSEQFDEQEHQSHSHNKQVEHVRSDDASQVTHRGLRVESPIDGEEIVGTE